MAFPLRLTPEEEEKVAGLKRITGQNTSSGAIKDVINNYEELNNRYLTEIEKRKKAEYGFSELKQKVAILFSTFDEIKKI